MGCAGGVDGDGGLGDLVAGLGCGWDGGLEWGVLEGGRKEERWLSELDRNGSLKSCTIC